jgi:putative copper export protein
MMLEIRMIVRAVHVLAAAAWVGGSLMYLVVVQPALRKGAPAPVVAGQVAELFKKLVNVCIAALVLSGLYLIVDRLSQTMLGWPYLVILGVKVAAAIAMFVVAMYLGQSNLRRLAKRSTSFSKAAPQLMLALGILVFVLGAVLNVLFEATIAPH